MSDFTVSFGFEDDSTLPVGNSSSAIEFLCEPDLWGKIPQPERSIRWAPEWFKRLDRELGIKDAQGLPGMTIKACLPVTDVFSLGFMLPLPFDVQMNVPEDRVSIQLGWADNVPFQPIESHLPSQIGAPEPPFESTMPLKFINPWRIKVPDGYSVLFSQPLSRPDLPYTCFSGLVDCDRFDTTVNIPFVWTGPVGEAFLPAGTPIAQIIPIKRDSLLKQTVARAATAAEMEQQAGAKQRKYHEESTYSREWRVKK
ncbi:MAG: hypothetical protein WAT93_02130 [Pontixanthobacter sp.]